MSALGASALAHGALVLALIRSPGPTPEGSWAALEVVRMEEAAGEITVPDVLGGEAEPVQEASVERLPEAQEPVADGPPPASEPRPPAPEVPSEPDPVALPDVDARPDAAAAEAIAALQPEAPAAVAAVTPPDEPAPIERTDASEVAAEPHATPRGRPLAGFEGRTARSGAPEGGLDDPALAVWMVRVQAHLSRAFQPPPGATAGARLACRMRLHLDPRTGEVQGATLLTSSGHAAWDEAAIAAVRAGGVPAPPASAWHLVAEGVDIRFAPR